MQAFHGDKAVQTYFVNRVRAHRIAGEIIQNYYWGGGRGCAVGCTIHGTDLLTYERELGIPANLASLKDRVFEGMPLPDAIRWPEEFLLAIRPGADLSNVWPQFAVWLLEHPADGVIQYANTEGTRRVIQGVANLYRQRGSDTNESRWRAEAHWATEEAAKEVAAAKQVANGVASRAACLAAAETAEAAAIAHWAEARRAARWVAEASESAAVAEATAEGAAWTEVAVGVAADAYLRQSLKLRDLLRAA